MSKTQPYGEVDYINHNLLWKYQEYVLSMRVFLQVHSLQLEMIVLSTLLPAKTPTIVVNVKKNLWLRRTWVLELEYLRHAVWKFGNLAVKGQNSSTSCLRIKVHLLKHHIFPRSLDYQILTLSCAAKQ